MKRFGTLFILLIIASLVLAACQPKEEAPVSEPTTSQGIVVNQPSGGFVPNMAGVTTECTLKKIIPEIPANQIPPVPMASEDDWGLGSLDAETSILA